MHVYSLLCPLIMLGCLYIIIDNSFYDRLSDLLYSKNNIDEERFIEDNFRKTPEKGDLFDYCPYELPDPWHESIAKYVNVKYGFETGCDLANASAPVTKLDGRKVVLLKGYEHFNCTARCLFYLTDTKYRSSEWKSIKGASFACDFIETECKYGNATNRFIHMRIEEKKSQKHEPVLVREKNPDVHLIVLDSVASTHFIRALPRTVNFLINSMSAIEFRKLNKIGWNSRPAGFATLLGKTTEPVVRELMGLETVPEDMKEADFCSKYLDNETYIPKEYKKAGYKTFDAEDYVTSLLHYPNCRGLKENILDHYYRPFYSRIVQDKELHRIHEKRNCRGSVDNILEYLDYFINSYKDTPKFSLSWIVDLSHGSGLDLYKGDYTIYNFFFKNRKTLSNSFVFFFGDHGARMGREAFTSFGHKEQSNPFMYVMTPKSLRTAKVYEQLVENSKQLITHLDLHATLKDILYFQRASNFTDLEFKVFNQDSRGSSLLRRFQAKKPRNCKTLPIPFQYCICQYEKVKVNDEALRERLGSFAVEQLGSFLKSHNVSTQCEEIKLHKVEAQQYVSTKISMSNSTSFFEVNFEVEPPARGRFQIPIRIEMGQLDHGGTLFTRMDKYGKNGDCMNSDLLRPYCTCKKK